MKNESVKSLNNIFVVKTYGSNSTLKEKYVPSQKKIRYLEIAYEKKVNEKESKNPIWSGS